MVSPVDFMVSLRNIPVYQRYPKLYGRLDRVTFDRYTTAKLQGFVWEKKRFFLQFENTNGLSIKNPYLNSFVCLLVFTVVSGAIESDFVEF